MSFIELNLSLKADSTEVEALSDYFFNHHALSISISDQDYNTSAEQAIFDQPGILLDKLWNNSLITVLFAATAPLELILIQFIGLYPAIKYTITHIDDQDWVRLTQNQFKPIVITEKLHIVPSWNQLVDPGITKIILDPGLAFGTGSHPTTFMCLQWLSDHLKLHDSLLDYGCGSGILAITAKKIGGAKVDGVDIDPQAIEAARANAIINHTELNFYSVDEFHNSSYHIVMANILANPLCILASFLFNNLKSQGKLILSGILTSQVIEITKIYAQYSTVKLYNVQQDWALLECTKND